MEKKKKFIVNTAYLLVLAILVYLGIKYLIPVLMPFLIAFLVASMINHPAGWVSNKLNINKKPVAILITAGFFVALAVLVMFTGSKLLSFAGDVIMQIPNIYKEEILPILNSAFQNIEAKAISIDKDIVKSLVEQFNTITQNLGQYISEFSVKAVRFISGYAAGIPSFVIKLVITIVATFFMAKDYEKITGFMISLLPEKSQGICRKIKEYTAGVVLVYIKSYSLLMLITFVELSVGLLILRIPYAVAIALAIAIFDILPVLGTGGILIPWAVITAVIGNYKLAVGLIILYLVILAVRNTIEPRIIGKQIGIHPLVMLISMFVGLKLLGVIGMIGLPVFLSVLVDMDKNGVINLFHTYK